MPALILDMDGILIDSEPLWRKSMVKVFGLHGFHTDEEECRKTKGMKIREVVEHLNRTYHLGWKDYDRIVNEIEEDLLRRIQEEGNAIPGATELLKYIYMLSDWKTGLATSSSRRLMHATLEKLNLEEYFHACVCAEGTIRAKPHPDIYLACANELGVKPDKCYAVEDSWFGVLAAQAAGMKVLAVPETEEEEKKFLEITPYVFRSMKEANENFKKIISNEV